MLRRIILSELAVLILATAALWVRSYYACDALYHRGDESEQMLAIASGVITFTNDGFYAPNSDKPSWQLYTDNPLDGGADTRPSIAGFGFERDRERIALHMPPWFLRLGMLAGFVLVWRRRKHPTGHCPACGYDLRATPERCPECGTISKKIVKISD